MYIKTTRYIYPHTELANWEEKVNKTKLEFVTGLIKKDPDVKITVKVKTGSGYDIISF